MIRRWKDAHKVRQIFAEDAVGSNVWNAGGEKKATTEVVTTSQVPQPTTWGTKAVTVAAEHILSLSRSAVPKTALSFDKVYWWSEEEERARNHFVNVTPLWPCVKCFFVQSKHLKGQLGPSVSHITFLHQRRSVGAPHESCHVFFYQRRSLYKRKVYVTNNEHFLYTTWAPEVRSKTLRATQKTKKSPVQ